MSRVSGPPSIGFLRPDLGIGGSARLATDAAIALSQRGYRATMFVPERKGVAEFPGLTRHGIAVERAGAFLPFAIGGRLRAPMAIARTAFAAWQMSRAADRLDLVFCDVVPHVIPWVARLTGRPVLYYCHYPDLLLTRDNSRQSAVYRRYRGPVDNLEAMGMAAAQLVVTNSAYTARVVRRVFPQLEESRLQILYPGVRVERAVPPPSASDGDICILSISRFDPRKNLILAVDALAALRQRVSTTIFARVRLVLAGQYDARLPESVALVAALRRRAQDTNLTDRVEFRFSLTEQERAALISRSRCVIYTPTAEHFGYVPVEAMAAGRPVVAVNNGGPSETIVHGTTGFLCDGSAESFADALAQLVTNAEAANSMGQRGHAHVTARFSLDAFGDGLDRLIRELMMVDARQWPAVHRPQ